MAISAPEGTDVLQLTTWNDQEVQALQRVRGAAGSMMSQLAAGVGCDPTQAMPGATTCRHYGLATFASHVESFQRVWNANFKTFAARMYAEEIDPNHGNPDIDDVLTVGLGVDGKYGPKTATAMVLVGGDWAAQGGFPPKCACQMRAFMATDAGINAARGIVMPVVNQLTPSAPPDDPEPQQPQQPQQPPPAVVQFQQDQPVAGTLGRETNTTVYWGVGILALLAAGGTWYYLKGRKGRR
jgi:hypothetical protein